MKIIPQKSLGQNFLMDKNIIDASNTERKPRTGRKRDKPSKERRRAYNKAKKDRKRVKARNELSATKPPNLLVVNLPVNPNPFNQYERGK